MVELQQAGMHRYLTERWDMAVLREAAREIRHVPAEDWDRYENPFERKWTLRDKRPEALPPALASVLALLESQVDHLSGAFGVPLLLDAGRHYAGVFRYGVADQLGVHVDAGIHPAMRLRKHVTALIYLDNVEGGELELWAGTTCCTPDPHLFHYDLTVPCELGRVIFFENNDYAWHGVQPNYRRWPERLVATVSFLSRAVDGPWHNRRERAFFVPRPHEVWTDEMYDLRDRRADAERFAEAYRV